MKISWLCIKVIYHSLVTGKQNIIIFLDSSLWIHNTRIFFLNSFVKTIITYQFYMVTWTNEPFLNKFIRDPEYGTILFSCSVVKLASNTENFTIFHLPHGCHPYTVNHRARINEVVFLLSFIFHSFLYSVDIFHF